jgi:hypothetical protein
LSAELEPKPTHQPPNASSIAGKTNLHQRQYEIKVYRPASQKQNLFLNTGDNQTRFFSWFEKTTP